MNRTSGNSTGQIILDFHIARTWSKSFIFYDKDDSGNVSNHDVTTDTWEFFIKRYAGDRVKQISLTAGSGLSFPSYEDNTIQVDFTSTQTNIEEGEYYFELYNQTEERTYVSQKCYFSYAGPAADPAQADAEIFIDSGGIEVNLISASGGISSVVTDGVTITGDGTVANPLVAAGSSGGLQAANNLSDVASALTSRQNLSVAHDRLTIFDKSSSFTVALTDFYSAGTRKTNPEYNVTATATATLKQDSDEAIPVGYVANFRVATGVTLTFAAGSGATVTTTSGGFTLVGSSSGHKYGFAVKTAANTWVVMNGDPASGSFTEFALFATALTFTNMPSGAQEIAAGTTGRYRTKADLTNFSQIRCVISFSTAGATNAGFYLEYSTDQSSWTTLGTATGSDLASVAGTAGANVSAWITLPAGAKADVWLRGMGVGGDGAADPVIGRVCAQVK